MMIEEILSHNNYLIHLGKRNKEGERLKSHWSLVLRGFK